jgi:hypothetical protein
MCWCVDMVELMLDVVVLMCRCGGIRVNLPHRHSYFGWLSMEYVVVIFTAPNWEYPQRLPTSLNNVGIEVRRWRSRFGEPHLRVCGSASRRVGASASLRVFESYGVNHDTSRPQTSNPLNAAIASGELLFGAHRVWYTFLHEVIVFKYHQKISILLTLTSVISGTRRKTK